MLWMDRRLLFLIAQVSPGPAECKHLTNSCWPGAGAGQALTSVSFPLFFPLFGAPQGTDWDSSASVFHSAKGRCSRTRCVHIHRRTCCSGASIKMEQAILISAPIFAFLAWVEYWTGSFDEYLFGLLNGWLVYQKLSLTRKSNYKIK